MEDVARVRVSLRVGVSGYLGRAALKAHHTPHCLSSGPVLQSKSGGPAGARAVKRLLPISEVLFRPHPLTPTRRRLFNL